MLKWTGYSTDRVWHKTVEARDLIDLFHQLNHPELNVIDDEALMVEANEKWPDVAKLNQQYEDLLENDEDDKAGNVFDKAYELAQSKVYKMTDEELESFITSFKNQAFYQEIEEI